MLDLDLVYRVDRLLAARVAQGKVAEPKEDGPRRRIICAGCVGQNSSMREWKKVFVSADAKEKVWTYG
jgi:hypothetical protein